MFVYLRDKYLTEANDKLSLTRQVIFYVVVVLVVEVYYTNTALHEGEN